MFETFDNPVLILFGTTGALAVVHTLMGIDHSVPFVAMARSEGWTLSHTLRVTLFCGLGHLVSSVLVGGLCVALGLTLDSMLWLDTIRGNMAAMMLIGFGLAFSIFAWRKRFLSSPKSRSAREKDQINEQNSFGIYGGDQFKRVQGRRRVTPWMLFLIFVLGPCEPLIPLMMLSPLEYSWLVLVTVVAIFGLLTIVTMVLSVVLLYQGVDLFKNMRSFRHGDVIAGFAVAGCGVVVLVLGV